MKQVGWQLLKTQIISTFTLKISKGLRNESTLASVRLSSISDILLV
jgi:hypothetical protein